MADPAGLDRLVHRVAAEVRLRRAEYYGLRGLFWGALLAVLPLLAKSWIGAAAPVVAVGLIAAGVGAGVILGLSLPAPRADAARLADRAFGLQDRVATALEWAARPARTPLVDALVQDAAARVESLEVRRVVQRVLPREARLLPLPFAAVVALALLPAISLPIGRLPDFTATPEEEAARERADALQTADRSRDKPEAVKAEGLTERDFERPNASMIHAGDRPALFKDTALSGERPDFSAFMKKGDERLRLLEQVDSLPDLQSDFTQSQYQKLAQQSKALTAGLRPDQIPLEKLRELLEQMEQMGNKEANGPGQAASQGLKALEEGKQDRAVDAMNRSLNSMRQSDEQRKGALNLSGGRQGNTGRRSTESGDSKEQGTPEQEEPGTSKGLLPGNGPGGQPKGDPTSRLHAKPYDSKLEGDQGSGKKDSFETNMLGHAAQVPSRLQTGAVFDQYRKMMEDAIAREQVPRDYQPQVKDYFRALGEK